MGNLLDIPPPPPKVRPTSETDHHNVLDKTPSADPVYRHPSGRYIGRLPLVAGNHSYGPFSAYPYNYPASYGSPEAANITDSVNVHQYMPAIHVTTFPEYPTTAYPNNGSHGNQDGVVLREYRTKKSHSRQKRISQKKEVHDNSSKTDVTSTIIAILPNAHDDHVKKGHEIVVCNGAPGWHSEPLPTITSGVIKPYSSSAETADFYKQDLVVQNQVTSAPVATRGSTYITYIQDDPPPSPPQPPSQPEASTTPHLAEESLKSEAVLENKATESSLRHGNANQEVALLLIDTPVAPATMVVKETSSRSVISDWLKRVSSTHRSTLPSPDVVLWYDPSGSEAMWRLRREIQSEGLSLAVGSGAGAPVGAGFLDWSDFSQAVVNAKAMIVLLSCHSVKNKRLRDQVALALATDTPLHPVALEPALDILTAMDISLKLLLGSHLWTELAQGEGPDFNIEVLVRGVKDELDVIKSYDVVDEDYGEVSSWAQNKKRTFRQRHLKRQVSVGSPLTASQYWDKFYAKGVGSIPWSRFSKDLRTEYRELFKCVVPTSCTPRLMDNLKRGLWAHRDGLVHKVEFVDFCKGQCIHQDVWERIRTVARETQALLDVLDAQSTVRVVALQNTDKLINQGLVLALIDLMDDSDPRIRAIATLSLSRCALAKDPAILAAIKATLNDKDGLVREAGYLALGHLNERGVVDNSKSCDPIRPVEGFKCTNLLE